MKKKDSYHNTLCVYCGNYFHGYTGLNLHNSTSRCGRIVKGTLTDHDREQINKYPKRWKLQPQDKLK